MKRFFAFAAFCLLWSGQSRAADIHDLLDAAARQPGYDISVLSIQESALKQEGATAALFPRIDLFGREKSIIRRPTCGPCRPRRSTSRRGTRSPFPGKFCDTA